MLRQGLGVVCNKENGFGEDDFVVEFLGEVQKFEVAKNMCLYL